MLKLPFKTSPKFERITVGNAEIGELEIPKYGDLSPNERIFIKAAQLVDVRRAAIKLARDIAAKSNQKVIDVYNALVVGNAGFLSDFLEDFVNFQDMTDENSRHRTLVLATAIIKLRLVDDWSLEDTQDPNQIHPQLVAAVADFARSEESGWAEPVEATEDDLEGNSTTPVENPTGEKFIGESEDTGPVSNDSVNEDLATSQPG